MGMAESDIEIVLNERDIKRLAIVCGDHFAFENLLDEIIQVLSIDISFNLATVIKRNGCYWVIVAIQTCRFYIQIDRWIPELGKESPGLICRQALRKINRIVLI
jgi:hypothetical protein